MPQNRLISLSPLLSLPSWLVSLSCVCVLVRPAVLVLLPAFLTWTGTAKDALCSSKNLTVKCLLLLGGTLIIGKTNFGTYYHDRILVTCKSVCLWYTIFTFFNPEPDGHWRIFALPLQCPDHTGSGSQLKLDGLHLVSPLLVSSGLQLRGVALSSHLQLEAFLGQNFSINLITKAWQTK
ncbi:hypothetical protein CsSME_00054220 [Camellia sinensis var. sinensis]